MTIHLPENVERSIQAAVYSGRFKSVDDAMTRAATLLLQELDQEQSQAKPAAEQADAAAPRRKPLWERAAELRKSIPEEEWAKLPVDGAEQLDHYIYGSPKRPSS
jgi:Arc/MetJ-type ribon-helix-helix transcriptional regulator